MRNTANLLRLKVESSMVHLRGTSHLEAETGKLEENGMPRCKCAHTLVTFLATVSKEYIGSVKIGSVKQCAFVPRWKGGAGGGVRTSLPSSVLLYYIVHNHEHPSIYLAKNG